MAYTKRLDRLGNALLLSVSWLEYVWNKTTKVAPVAVLDIDFDVLTVSLYSDSQYETIKFKDKLQVMMNSVDEEIQNGYGGMD
jgi:hypothetical protein